MILQSWSRATPLTRGLALLLAAVLAAGVLDLASGERSALVYAAGALFGIAYGDSWHPMWLAAERAHAEPAATLYATLFFRDGVKFIYPPSSLLPLEVLRAGGLRDEGTATLVLNRLAWFAYVALAFTCAALLAHARERAWLGATPAREAAWQRWLVVALVLVAWPVARGVTLGQVQTFLTLAVALALLAWVHGREGLAGALIGAAACVKPHLGLLLVWGLVRGRWRMVASGGAVAGVVGAIALARYGLPAHLDYLRVLGFVSRRGDGFIGNQSVNGLLHRLLETTPPGTFDEKVWPPEVPLVRVATAVASAGFIALALLARRRAYDALALGTAALALTMASPIAWEHHYGVLAPLLALAAPAMLAARVAGPRTAWLLGALVLVLSQRLAVLLPLAASPVNLLQSLFFFAALAVLGLLLAVPRATSPDPRPEPRVPFAARQRLPSPS